MKPVDPHIDPEIEEAENTLVEILLNLYLQNQKEEADVH